jgi:membrane-bound metal-dependent hydrolase YbcI (DUF457 family)
MQVSIGQRAVRARLSDWFDRAAVGASALCLVHCAGLPLLLAALPSLSRLIAVPESLHLWVLAFAIPTSGATLILGHRKHRAWTPLLTGASGLALLSVGALAPADSPSEIPVTMLGSICLVFAHIANWRARHREHRHGQA